MVAQSTTKRPGLAARMLSQRTAAITLVHGCTPRLSLSRRAPAQSNAKWYAGSRPLEEAELALSALVDHDSRIMITAVPQTGIEALLHESNQADVLIVQRRGGSSILAPTAPPHRTLSRPKPRVR